MAGIVFISTPEGPFLLEGADLPTRYFRVEDAIGLGAIYDTLTRTTQIALAERGVDRQGFEEPLVRAYYMAAAASLQREREAAADYPTDLLRGA